MLYSHIYEYGYEYAHVKNHSYDLLVDVVFAYMSMYNVNTHTIINLGYVHIYAYMNRSTNTNAAKSLLPNKQFIIND